MPIAATRELHGVTLDWAVARCEGKNGILHDDGITRCIVLASATGVYNGVYKPSSNWALGGPIITRKRIELCVDRCDDSDLTWHATIELDERYLDGEGTTPLIAAMRCYVASKFGETINIPENLA